MGKSSPQNLRNHGRIDPPFHFVLLLVLLVNLIVSIVYVVHHLCFYSVWLVVLSVALILLAFKARQYPIKVQDRLIRLEERLRLQALAPAEWHTQINRLSDDEVVALAKQALEHHLTRKQIKERIQSWRADYFRV